jgi:pimeloyl-ACP methyl ester carboxylesterase
LATFCLIHGRWHDGSCWTPVVERLRLRGHEAVAPDLPFDDPRATHEERARPALDALADVPDPIVVVGHSGGSSEAALVAAKRRPALLVYLCPRFGEFSAAPDAPAPFRAGFPFPATDDQGRAVWQPQDAIRVMYPRLPAETASRLASRLRPAASAVGPYPLAEPPDVSSALVFTSDDEFFTPEWQRYVANDLLGIEPIELPGGHFPMIEDPDMLADLLDRLA